MASTSDPTVDDIGSATTAVSDANRLDDTAPSTVSAVLPDRYRLGQRLGAGGMGEVFLAKDSTIGRDVAVKIMRPEVREVPEVQDRFFREARVQGQLEHPAIVPVYDLFGEAEGTPFFTMKRIRGRTLRDVLRGLAQEDADVVRTYSTRKLLSALSSVCLAVDFAHTRGVVHRDLKPENIMLGDFGEVYVLDWGIAKVGDTESAEDSAVLDVNTGDETQQGHIMGTLAYMPPERIEQNTGTSTPAADVYALGAILFEILTLEPLNPRATPAVMIRRAVEGLDARASVRAPRREIAPELDAICAGATAKDPRERTQSARALQDRIERYLDGDRDLELRKRLAGEHVAAARAALGGELARADHDARAQAMREATRALALDPENGAAMEITARLVLEPPDEVPAEVEEHLARETTSSIRAQASLGWVAYLLWLLSFPLMLVMGVRDPLQFSLLYALVLWGLTTDFLTSTGRLEPTMGRRIALVTTALLIALLGRSFSPWIGVPGIASAIMVSLILHGDRRWRTHVLVVFIFAMFSPMLLELAGVVPPTFTIEANEVRAKVSMLDLPAVPAMILLGFAILCGLLVPALSIIRTHEQLLAARRKLELQAWHLRRALPELR